jgi:hypothetical protein
MTSSIRHVRINKANTNRLSFDTLESVETSIKCGRVMRNRLYCAAAFLLCCCDARLLPDLDVVPNTATTEQSILSSVQQAQDTFMAGLLSKYGSQYEHKLFTDAFYELSDNGAAIQRRFLQRMVHQGNFTMAFTGISNTAGIPSLSYSLSSRAAGILVNRARLANILRRSR